MYDRGLVEPGSSFDVDVILTSRSETPTECVVVTLSSEVAVSIPQGKTSATAAGRLAPDQSFRWEPGTLAVGEHRRRIRFSIAPNSPPSYRASGWSRVSYVIEVHVVIPMWIDRHAHFAVPVAAPARLPAGASTAALVATHPSGPRANQLYIEASLDATQLRPGDELRGDVSFANVSTKRIRRVTVAFVVFEHTREPLEANTIVARWAATLVSGAPIEDESYAFRFTIPRDLWPSFDARAFALQWQFVITADVVLGADVTLSIPLDVIRTPPGVEMPVSARRALPVGRQRLARLWAIVAQRVGLAYDEAEGAMLATRGAVSMKLVREAFQGTLGVVAHYRYPHLGLDLHFGERALFDPLLAKNRFVSPLESLNERYTIVGRDRDQLAAFFDPSLAQLLGTATSVVADDDLAHVRVAGVANSAQSLERVARDAVALLERLDRSIARIPVPRAMAPHERAWRDFAATLGGRFEAGRAWIHDANVQGFRCEIGTAWEPRDASKPRYTVVQFPIEPPLEREPHVEDAALSALARERLRALSTLEGFHATTTEIGFALASLTPDPSTLLAHLESIAEVLRALRGQVAAGPFR